MEEWERDPADIIIKYTHPEIIEINNNARKKLQWSTSFCASVKNSSFKKRMLIIISDQGWK